MQSALPKLQICTDSPAIKRALCVAVRYEHLNPDGLELTSTHKDAHTVSKLLIDRYGYEEKDITLLLDDDDPNHDQPTQRNITRAMEDLVHGAKPGDRFVFHFSGHGSQVKNLDGSEEDGKDEVIWPLDIEIDSDRLDEDDLPMVNNYILDDIYRIAILTIGRLPALRQVPLITEFGVI
ncbi:hypothetical protein PHLCEN_2v8365 [Hermanssonia centrifuga]|uniref:Peptidase C14 caspase domain-containing protein n=1 Tax=Hermanssonia centrifuga TaxID=98765 RepID=A0A2R6NTX2_9APHY|nr:hypothetical protein PHLCEN_2v8365 [Hermanssonia centrifuga]